MRTFELKMNAEDFAFELSKSVLVFMRPLRAKHFRLLRIPEEYKNNIDLVKMLNQYTKRNIKGIRFFMINSFDDKFGETLNLLDVPHVFMEPDIPGTVSAVNETTGWN